MRVIFNKVSNQAALVETSSDAVAFDNVQVLISVSKRHFKHAVGRNRAKRQIREAWRLNRDILAPLFQVLPVQEDLQNDNSSATSTPRASLHLAFIWLSDEPQPTELVQRKMKNLLHRICEQLD